MPDLEPIGAERRVHDRIEIVLEAELFLPDEAAPLIVHTRDISIGGVFIILEFDKLPPQGSVVKVKLKSPQKTDPPAIDMKVVHTRNEGVGLMYID
jgi:hypothetical protein